MTVPDSFGSLLTRILLNKKTALQPIGVVKPFFDYRVPSRKRGESQRAKKALGTNTVHNKSHTVTPVLPQQQTILIPTSLIGGCALLEPNLLPPL